MSGKEYQATRYMCREGLGFSTYTTYPSRHVSGRGEKVSKQNLITQHVRTRSFSDLTKPMPYFNTKPTSKLKPKPKIQPDSSKNPSGKSRPLSSKTFHKPDSLKGNELSKPSISDEKYSLIVKPGVLQSKMDKLLLKQKARRQEAELKLLELENFCTEQEYRSEIISHAEEVEKEQYHTALHAHHRSELKSPGTTAAAIVISINDASEFEGSQLRLGEPTIEVPGGQTDSVQSAVKQCDASFQPIQVSLKTFSDAEIVLQGFAPIDTNLASVDPAAKLHVPGVIHSSESNPCDYYTEPGQGYVHDLDLPVQTLAVNKYIPGRSRAVTIDDLLSGPQLTSTRRLPLPRFRCSLVAIRPDPIDPKYQIFITQKYRDRWKMYFNYLTP